MVRTMSLLRALLRTVRLVRHTPRLADGLPPDEAILLDAPDSRIGPALVAAAHGEYEPAAKLLATTREAAEWEHRDRYVMRLAVFAYSRGDWLASWLADAPRDPDALIVKTELAIRRAWESPARAERLREIGPLIDAAAEAAPGDPVPWRIALDHARGTHAVHTAFETLWEQAVRRSPHHYGCHVAALRYLSAQWYGSHRECFDFAERAAADAPPGSLMPALPARAAFARMEAEDTFPVRPGSVRPLEEERTDAAADRAIALSAGYPAGDPWPAEVRNLTAYVLVRQGRWTDALEQFRLIGSYATSFPWNRFSDDPLGRFLDAREGVRLRLAAMAPPRARTGRSWLAGH
ncbi:hypothetical protein [Streptomyces jumonjinensis]|uniref:DUF4034 domain-containing protein n=1 Tax=Streptomyces jumonjinensis TaxID=1945 RepID=A0A646KDU9_STRJU|nr:hypothetical protein [Streptomyces jumonjinensis]MQT00298.1 hypothetical protein [Streptomyces jumonjinensis]